MNQAAQPDRSGIAGRFTALLRRNRTPLVQALRVTIACAITYSIILLFNLPQGFWAIVTVLIVMQGNVGATLGAATDRLVATVAGAIVGGIAILVLPHRPLEIGIGLVVVVAMTSFVAARVPRLRVAGLTATIVILTRTSDIPVTVFVVERILEITLGGVVGVLASRFVLPAKSRKLLLARLHAVLDAMIEALRSQAEALEQGKGAAAVEASVSLRKSLTEAEALLGDVERERSMLLAKSGVSEAVVRTLWRIRNDMAHLNRLIEQPLAPGEVAALGHRAAEVLRAECLYAERCGDAMETARSVDRSQDDEAIAAFDAAFGTFSRSAAVQALPFDEVGRLFGLAFALRKMRQDFHDLADRIDEGAAKT